jgi:hypothetical protein
MALVLRSNPISLGKSTGALFVSNPSKPRKVRRNAKRKAKSVKRKNPIRLKKRKNPAKKRSVARKNPALKLRRNALMIKKNPVRKVRRNARRKMRLNPLSKLLRKNPTKTLLPSIVESAKRMISRIPYVGKPIANNLLASVSGMVGGLVFAYGYKKFSDMLAQQSAKAPESTLYKYLNTVDKYSGLALVGIGLGVLANTKTVKGVLGEKTSSMVGKGAIVVGGALQAVRLWNMWAESKGKPSLQLDASAPSSAPATSGLMYGDGGSYDVVPLSGVHQMGMMHMHKNPQHARMSGFYSGAKPSDAVMTSSDLSPQEVRSAMVGDEQSYSQSFEQVPMRMTNTDIYSCYAGKHGVG